MDNQIKDDCRVQLLEHVPYVALCVRKDNACMRSVKNKINRSRNFALDAENDKAVTPTLQLTLDRTK